jgi:uncharacterized protein YlzI (FlbEa/FlbD family)
MITVTRPKSVDRDNDEQISINEKNINQVKSLPKDSEVEGNSKIIMNDGDTIIVKESKEEVDRKIEEKK